jgi:hypothetical protein
VNTRHRTNTLNDNTKNTIVYCLPTKTVFMAIGSA